jgi:hypothetical protein
VIGVITFIGNDGFGLKVSDEIVRPGDVVALACPRRSRTGLPSASVAAWIFVLNPPPERPRP